jgi:hypothetical protein
MIVAFVFIILHRFLQFITHNIKVYKCEDQQVNFILHLGIAYHLLYKFTIDSIQTIVLLYIQIIWKILQFGEQFANLDRLTLLKF